jgi:predicted Rossmann fold flavoprotein
MLPEQINTVIIGGGASGLLCASTIGAGAMVLEHNDQLGKKIKISGGGHCNFTNLEAGPDNYISSNPHFCKSALARFTPWDFVSMVSEKGIQWEEKDNSELFCTDSASEIVDMLTQRCKANGVIICNGVSVKKIIKGYSVITDKGIVCCENIVIATGGLSYTKIGATDLGHQVARSFGLKIIEPRPALVPLHFSGELLKFCSSISGLSIPVTTTAESKSFSGDLLFTHRGLSGPAVLQISSYMKKDVTIDLLPGRNLESVFQSNISLPPVAVLSKVWPKKLAMAWSRFNGLTTPWAQISKPDQRKLIDTIHAWKITSAKSGGYAKAEVTRGGVDTRQINSKSMEANAVPGLYFIGEVLDVTGQLGGFNFQWAWSSAIACGESIKCR